MLLVDAHVHFRRCFSANVFLTSALSNFRIASVRVGGGRGFMGCLLMADDHDEQGFERIKSGVGVDPSWQVRDTGEACSLMVERLPFERLLLVAGRQLVTSEGIEVLALATSEHVQNGQSLRTTLDRVRELGALPVVPWGFGKWWGRRGAAVRGMLAEEEMHRGVFIGESGNRPRPGRRMGLLRQAAESGAIILPGSDPLPLRSHSGRAGSMGFALDPWIQTDHPARELRNRVGKLIQSPPAFGTGASLVRFVRDQAAMQWRKRRNQGSEALGVS